LLPYLQEWPESQSKLQVIDHYLQLHSEQRILFLVPTKALVKQQADS
jgi:ERCC4-related helicase